MLSEAINRASGRHERRARRDWIHVGRGKAGTAKALQARGYGRYVSDGYEARFYINSDAVHLAESDANRIILWRLRESGGWHQLQPGAPIPDDVDAESVEALILSGKNRVTGTTEMGWCRACSSVQQFTLPPSFCQNGCGVEVEAATALVILPTLQSHD